MASEGSVPSGCDVIFHQFLWWAEGNMAETLTVKRFCPEITQAISAQGRFILPGSLPNLTKYMKVFVLGAVFQQA